MKAELLGIFLLKHWELVQVNLWVIIWLFFLKAFFDVNHF